MIRFLDEERKPFFNRTKRRRMKGGSSVIKKIGFAFRVELGLSIAIIGLLVALSATVLIFLQGFRLIDAPTLIKSLFGVGGAIFFLGIGIYAIAGQFQIWHKVNYGDKKFGFWSTRVRGFGDETLAKDSSSKDWKKVIILKPVGDPKTTFSIGFNDIFGNTKISSATRRVEEGPFGMRMGPEDCDFFIVSNKGGVGLEFVEYADIGAKTKSKLPLY